MIKNKIINGVFSRIRSKYDQILLGSIGIILGISLWLVLVQFDMVPWYTLPRPEELAQLWIKESPDLLKNIGLTIMRSIRGFTIGSVIAILVIFVMSLSELINSLLEPIIQIFKPVPPLVLSPFMMIWFGSNDKGIIALGIWGAFFLVLVEGQEAIKSVPIVFTHAASSMGESNWGLRVRVMFPASVPHLIGALRIALLLVINLTILGEFTAANGGIGEIIVRGYRFLRPDILFFGVIVAIFVSVTLDIILRLISTRLRKWV